MKNIFKKLWEPIANFLNRMADQQAARLIEMYRQISKVQPNDNTRSHRTLA